MIELKLFINKNRDHPHENFANIAIAGGVVYAITAIKLGKDWGSSDKSKHRWIKAGYDPGTVGI